MSCHMLSTFLNFVKGGNKDKFGLKTILHKFKKDLRASHAESILKMQENITVQPFIYTKGLNSCFHRTARSTARVTQK